MKGKKARGTDAPPSPFYPLKPLGMIKRGREQPERNHAPGGRRGGGVNWSSFVHSASSGNAPAGLPGEEGRYPGVRLKGGGDFCAPANTTKTQQASLLVK